MRNYKFNIYKFLKVIKFGETEIEKHKLHQHKEPISIKNIDINKIVVPNIGLFS